MAVKHLNFAGKSAVGQRQRPQATKVLTKKVAKVAAAPKQKATLKNAVIGLAKGSAVATGNAARKTALAAGMKGALVAGAKSYAKATGRIAGEVYKSGGGYKSNPTYGKGLGVSTPAKKRK